MRDIVEIVAIIAAGIWAFYTFVYQNEIKPANSPTQTQVDASLKRLGERKGLIAVESHVAIVNAGVVDINVYGFAETVQGTTVRARAGLSPLPASAPPVHEMAEPVTEEGPPVFVFGFATLTRLGSSLSHDSIDLRPGQSVPFDRVFYVPAGRFDKLDLHISLRFASHPTPVPFRIVHDRGVIRVEPTDDIEVDGEEGTPATLSLWP